MRTNYEENGYLLLESFFTETEIIAVEKILNTFHEKWMKDNASNYEKGILNSHSLTSGNYLNVEEKTLLFQFISQDKLQEIIDKVFPIKPVFLNTQLFSIQRITIRKTIGIAIFNIRECLSKNRNRL